MHPSVMAALPDIARLCRRLGVVRLDLFGSATGEAFDPRTSDVDVLVEFDPTFDGDRFDSWFALKEGLESLLDRPVDVVSNANLHNPYVRAEVEKQREPLYAA